MLLLVSCLFSTIVVLLTTTARGVRGNLASEHRTFSDLLTLDLYKNENECTSCLGLSMAFDLIYPVAVGDTRQDMQVVFGFAESDEKKLQWKSTATSLTEAYNGVCLVQGGDSPIECESEAPLVTIAISVWVRDDVTLNPAYTAVVGDLTRTLNFTAQNAGSTVNSWVQNNTNGLIESIVEDGPFNPMWILLVVNALYLKASWQLQFEEHNTNEDAFYASALRESELSTKAHFMHMIDDFLYSGTAAPGYQVLKLAFNGQGQSSGLSMILALPIAKTDELLSSVDVLEALPSLKSTRVALALPKFKFESEYSNTLKESLMNIGLVAPFYGGLCVRDTSCEAFVDFVIQKTVIDVNEKGVEAAAVTAIGVSDTAAELDPPAPSLFLCDHPFQFFIYDANEDVVLFEGKVGNPGLPSSGTATLQSRHTEDDFWTNNFNVEPVAPSVDDPSGASGHSVNWLTLAQALLLLM